MPYNAVGPVVPLEVVEPIIIISHYATSEEKYDSTPDLIIHNCLPTLARESSHAARLPTSTPRDALTHMTGMNDDASGATATCGSATTWA